MKKSALRVAALGAVAGLFATMAPLTAHAATAPSTFPVSSDAEVYLMNNDTATQYAAGSQLDWNISSGVVLTAHSVPADLGDLSWATFPAATGGATQYIGFIAPAGSERTPSAWKEWGDFSAIGTGALLPAVWPGYLGNGTPAAVKAAGGTYSMGIAYTDSAVQSSTHVIKAYYTTINVDAGTGTWAFATPAPVVNKIDTTTALSAPATIGEGGAAALTATVTPSAATGNVEFFDGSTSLGIVASSGGVATKSATGLTAGSHTIKAVYAGDSAYNGSTSATATVVVTGGPDEASLVAGNVNGMAVAVNGATATVSGLAAVNGKVVNVYSYSTPTFLGQKTIASGGFTVNIGSLANGAHKLALVDVSTGAIVGWASFTVTSAVTGSPATRHLQAAVRTSVDGEFKLVAPDDTTPAVIGSPTLDAVTGESVSTGSLGAFAVVDDRQVALKGWTLSTDVAPFVNGSNTVANTALGVKPQLTSNTGPGTPTLGAEQVAGSAVYSSNFAELAAGTYSTRSDLNAGLTFRAPLGTPAGTYTSTLTLTLVSK